MMLFVLRFMNQQTFNGLGKAMQPTVGIQRDNWRGRCLQESHDAKIDALFQGYINP